MHMNDLCNEVNCKHVTWNNGRGDSRTAWLECNLKNCMTDLTECSKCKDRSPKRRESK